MIIGILESHWNYTNIDLLIDLIFQYYRKCTIYTNNVLLAVLHYVEGTFWVILASPPPPQHTLGLAKA